MDEIGPIAQDRLSGLPQEILTSIISKLDFNEAGRTCVLCQTFRNVWKTTKVIKIHNGQGIDRFRSLYEQRIEYFDKQGYFLDNWLQLMSLRMVRQVTLKVARTLTLFKVPTILYQTSSLVELTLASPTSINLPNNINLPNLKIFKQLIHNSEVWNSMSTLISHCSGLESLYLELNIGSTRLRRGPLPTTAMSLVCSHNGLQSLIITGGIFGLEALQPCSLHLQLPSLVQVHIHVNNPIKLVWKTSPTRLREKMINLPPS